MAVGPEVREDTERTRVVVIGAGQAGLSVAYYLRRLGLQPGSDFVVLDRGPSTGGAWQFRWRALRLGTAHRVNDLPGMADLGLSFETADRSAPAKDVVSDYYDRYERFYDLQVRRPVDVRAVDEAQDHALTVRSLDGAGLPHFLDTEIVVNATGTWGSPFRPWYPGRDSFAGRQLTTAEYTDAAEFAGQDVVVVGGGTSAIGFLLELEKVEAHTTWVTRRPVDWFDQQELGVEMGAAAVAEQDEAARAGFALPSIVSGTGVPLSRRNRAGIDRGILVEHPMFTSIEPDGVRFVDGTFRRADAILWATGFRPELRHLAPLKLRSGDGGLVVARGASQSDPRLFFAGYGPQASTIGANRAGRVIARQVLLALSTRRSPSRQAPVRTRDVDPPA
ncbi:oxidoreductase [Frondihabitans sucicola]|uniref:Oxidoreductase n=1 Tax=Frondihabitans sucicola TaxID=1268041 RepID=A0ABN6XSV7_9MICO|nr:NAD(P)-binding domain-containing protein [Frondihabitans sucicola]BDZ48087.1 oxidoreductase [Frondihabitans sucicola]